MPRAVSGRRWHDVALLRRLGDGQLRELAALMERRTFPPGHPIEDRGAPDGLVHIVQEGTVRLFHRGPHGREVTAHLVGPGSLFGLAALFGPPGAGPCAEAATPVEVYSADGREFLRVLSQWPEAMLDLVAELAARLHEVEQGLRQAAAGTTRTRLEHSLRRLALREGQHTPRDVSARDGRAPDAPEGVRVRVTRTALAREIGCSRETVSRLLAVLEAEGHIRRQGRTIAVVDPRWLDGGAGLV
jgi:CRP-like cAMP-binding protein